QGPILMPTVLTVPLALIVPLLTMLPTWLAVTEMPVVFEVMVPLLVMLWTEDWLTLMPGMLPPDTVPLLVSLPEIVEFWTATGPTLCPWPMEKPPIDLPPIVMPPAAAGAA